MGARERLRIGVDIGGTKIEAVVLRITADDAPPEVLARVRRATERDLGYEHILAASEQTIVDCAAEAGLRERPPIGVGMPGATTFRRADGSRSPIALVKNANTVCLNGRPFRADLAERLGGAVAFANDANCFALAEASFGVARGAAVVFGVIMGSGVGGGLVFGGAGRRPRAWDGLHGIAGEWGHTTLEPVDGPACYCGLRGCVERLICGPSLEAQYRARAGVARSLAEISARAASGEDAEAEAVIDGLVERFGRALATVIDVLDPSMIVLGGGVSNVPQLYDRGRAAVARWVFNDELVTPIVQHSLGDSAGVLGAAMLPDDSLPASV